MYVCVSTEYAWASVISLPFIFYLKFCSATKPGHPLPSHYTAHVLCSSMYVCLNLNSDFCICGCGMVVICDVKCMYSRLSANGYSSLLQTIAPRTVPSALSINRRGTDAMHSRPIIESLAHTFLGYKIACITLGIE